MIITYKYRLKSKNLKALNKLALEVNFVWNYYNEVSLRKFKESRQFLSEFDLNALTSGSSKSGLSLNARSIQEISRLYCKAKKQHKKVKLRWRSHKKLGFIPIRTLKMTDKGFEFNGKKFAVWKHREYVGTIKASKLSQDSKRNWYLNLVCEVPETVSKKATVGIDLGLKSVAVTSSGDTYDAENLTSGYAKKLAKAQRANKKKLTRNIHRKIKNKRLDRNHKIAKQITDKANIVYIGNVNSTRVSKNKHLRKSVTDRSWFQLKSILHYKAIRAGGYMKEINERFTTITCSACSHKTGPSGLSGLGIREWTCSNCNTLHDRDINSAINIEILGVGHDSLQRRSHPLG